MFQDLRFALRTLRKRPTTTAAAVLMLALGLGACTVVFSLVEAFLLRPLELEDPDRLARIYSTQEMSGAGRQRATPGAFYDWRRRSRTFESLVAAQDTGLSVTGAERPLNPRMRLVTEDYFETLGVEPVAGRLFLKEEYRAGARVAMLDHGFWQSYFGGDPVLGRTIELNYEAYEIVGVLPAGYLNPALPNPPVLWMPLAEPATPNRTFGNMVVLGRLAPGLGLADAQAEMERISAELGVIYPETDAGRGVRVLGLRDSLVETIRPALLALFGAVAFVLVMASANVANLLLARAIDRRTEIGVRMALGASRARLVRQLMTESLLLGLAAAAIGLMLAFWAVGPLPSLAPSNISMPLLDGVRLDVRVALFTVAAAVAAAVAFGLLPMMQVSRTSGAALSAGSRGRGRGPGRRRLRSSLVVTEVALSLVLLIGAGLMVRTLAALRSLDLGFDPVHLTTIRTGARGPVYGDVARYNEFHRLVGEELGRLPGVRAVGAAEILPMFAAFRTSFPARDAERPAAEGAQPRAIPLAASVGFFEAFGMPILRGRGFTSQDTPESEPVAVVSRGLSRRLWGDENPIGREIVLGDEGRRRARVVGIAGDLRGQVQAPEPPPVVYLAHAQSPVPNMSFFLRGETDLETLTSEAEQAIWEISRDVPVYFSTTMEQIVADIEWQPRFVMQLLSGFAIFALVLAAMGLFAVLSYAVSERHREIGIRVAVGAAGRDVLRLVLGDAARLTALGLVLGLAGALMVNRLLAGQLYGVEASDPLTYGVLVVVLGSVAFVASYLPARRATRIDPVQALRSE